MRILITGICGFVGSSVARHLLEAMEGLELMGMDNLSRPGSELNRRRLIESGVAVIHGDLRVAEDVANLPAVDWVIDAAADASVLSGLGPSKGSKQLFDNNLLGTLHLLEFCKRFRAGCILLSTSRVYSIPTLKAIDLVVENGAYRPNPDQTFPQGVGISGVGEGCSTQAPISLYGATKLASEVFALEYGAAFEFPVWVNRCGLLAGSGQFGRPDQGIVAYWIHAWRAGRPLRYIGFDGQGHQVRDCLHPADLTNLLRKQMHGASDQRQPPVVNVSGGAANGFSLRQLSDWCASRFGPGWVASSPEARAYDVPWLVLDRSLAEQHFQWSPARDRDSIFEEIAAHAEEKPDWLKISGV